MPALDRDGNPQPFTTALDGSPLNSRTRPLWLRFTHAGLIVALVLVVSRAIAPAIAARFSLGGFAAGALEFGLLVVVALLFDGLVRLLTRVVTR